MNQGSKFIAYQREKLAVDEVIKRSEAFYQFMDSRRTVREFSAEPIPRKVIDNIVLTASTAPSGAHKQPWTFCAVSDVEMKKKIRAAAEKEEYENYHGRMTDEWLADLSKFGTDWNKPFLEIAPWLLIVFRKNFELDQEGNKSKNYYVSESVGIATGFLLAAIHNAGLVALTHTPSPMNFLANILERPANEKAFLLIPIGYPVEQTQVPDIQRKEIESIINYFE